MQSNLKSHKFYHWFLTVGGQLATFNSDIAERASRIPLIHANLKSKSQEIKDKYNHKFKNNP